MKPEAQLIALLEWMGARGFQPQSGICYWPGHFIEKLRALHIPVFASEERTGELLTHIPPLTLDLMHEAENKLSENEAWLYRDFLQDLVIRTQPHGRATCSAHFLYGATKEQRLETLIRTIGQWKE